jgi:hypothetical protein
VILLCKQSQQKFPAMKNFCVNFFLVQKLKALAHSTFHTCFLLLQQRKTEKAKLWYGVGSPMGAI